MRYIYKAQSRLYMFYDEEKISPDGEIAIIIAAHERPHHIDNWLIVGEAFSKTLPNPQGQVNDYGCGLLGLGFLREIVGRYLIGERIS